MMILITIFVFRRLAEALHIDESTEAALNVPRMQYSSFLVNEAKYVSCCMDFCYSIFRYTALGFPDLVSHCALVQTLTCRTGAYNQKRFEVLLKNSNYFRANLTFIQSVEEAFENLIDIAKKVLCKSVTHPQLTSFHISLINSSTRY